MTVGALEEGQRAYLAQAWREAYGRFCVADRDSPLTADDLERAGRAAYLVGREDDYLVLIERAFQDRLRRDDPEGAALDAFWLVYVLMLRGEWARAGGWVERARRLIDDGERDCVARGYLLAPGALQALMGGDAETAYTTFSEQREIGVRHGDQDLVVLAGFGQGQALIALNRVDEGVALHDEIMVAVTGGETSAIVSGLVYCGVIAGCMDTFDPRRATEWTAALQHWCDAQPDLVPYRGHCLVHRAQIMQLHGAWVDALDEAQLAFERFSQAAHPAAGDALYERAELQRLCGEFGSAEQSYHQASGFGRDAQPGLALLRLAQGNVDAAMAGIRRAIDETLARVARPRLLAACVEVSLAARDVTAARTAADELTAVAEHLPATQLQAMAAYAQGAVRLADGDPAGALAAARRAWSLWQSLEAPYEAARARVIVGLACRSLGDEDAARMELDAAGQAFATLSAAPDLARIGALSGRPAVKAAHGLSPRELEVLRLVATGRTNRAIAADLTLSEKTVARHVSNIFGKLRVTSRAAATAFAYEHDLV